MRISDWSSDVCSSDLAVNCLTLYVATQYGRRGIRCNAIFPGLVLTPTTEAVLTPEQFAHIQLNSLSPFPSTAEDAAAAEIGRAPCRERVCPYGSLSVVCVALKNKI